MPALNARSERNLVTCHPDIITLFREVIKHVDCTITSGFRNRADQEAAVKTGASKLHFPNSKHNKRPSLAVDVYPNPVDVNDAEGLKVFAVQVKAIRDKLKAEGKIKSDITWGGDWKTRKDYPHWEIE